MKKVLILIIGLFVMTSCEKEGLTNVDSELIPFFDSFKQEATLRGIEIDVSFVDLEGDIEPIQDPRIVGQCYHNTEEPNQIKIDDKIWDSSSIIEKEFIVFHELGHCYLQRSHLNTKDEDGNCISIMQSGTGGCKDAYSRSTREEYINELFDQ